MNFLCRHSGAGRNPAGFKNISRSEQSRFVVLLRGVFDHLDSGLRRNDGRE
jgi:hypothetical protein